MTASEPNFSSFPFASLRRISRRDAALESAIARWLDARPGGPVFGKLAALVGESVEARLVAVHARRHADPHAALAEIRLAGATILLAAASMPIRAVAQRVLGGPAELAAPRPLSPVEQAMWALVAAAASADLGIAAEVWPLLDAAPDVGPESVAIELSITLGDAPLTVIAYVPRSLEVRPPPPRAWPAWTFDLPVIVARAAISADAVASLGPRDAITVEPTLELVIGDGAVGLRGSPGSLEATVATGYGRRDMALPDDAHLELTVQLGTTRLNLRQMSELAIGQIVPLGCPLAGPYEVRAAGRLVGKGELVDLDGELGVRIVSIAQE